MSDLYSGFELYLNHDLWALHHETFHASVINSFTKAELSCGVSSECEQGMALSLSISHSLLLQYVDSCSKWSSAWQLCHDLIVVYASYIRLIYLAYSIGLQQLLLSFAIKAISGLKKTKDAIECSKGEHSHPSIHLTLMLPASAHHADASPMTDRVRSLVDIASVARDVWLTLELRLEQTKLLSDFVSVDGRLDTLMIEQDCPKAGGGVGTDASVLSLWRDEGEQAWQECTVRQEVMLVRPVERWVTQEEKHIREQERERSGLRLLCSARRRRNRVHDEQAHFKDRLALEDGLLTFIGRSKGSQEADVVHQVVLEQTDVLLVLAHRLQLSVKVLNCSLLHEFFGDFSWHCESLKHGKHESHLCTIWLLIDCHESFSHDSHDASLSWLLKESWVLSDEWVLESHILRGHRNHSLQALLYDRWKLRVGSKLLKNWSKEHYKLLTEWASRLFGVWCLCSNVNLRILANERSALHLRLTWLLIHCRWITLVYWLNK